MVMMSIPILLLVVQFQVVEYTILLLSFFLCANILLIRKFTLYSLKLGGNATILDILSVFTSCFWALMCMSIFCELGERVTNHFETVDEELQRCDWHMLPIEVQRIYLIFISDTQQPRNITCYGDISSTRDTFKKVFQLRSPYESE